jgi:hypothetical protein
MGSYSDYLRRDTEFLIGRFHYMVLTDLERQIRDVERKIVFVEIHREELVWTRDGWADHAKFVAMLSTKSEAEKLAIRFKVALKTRYWLTGAFPPPPVLLVAKRQTEAEVRAFPASLRLKPQQARLEAWRKAQTPTDPLRLSHKARLPLAAAVTCLDCPTREALAQLKRSMALCKRTHGLDI